ncbi:hypothetical protein P4C99_04690 [Pontiellaceae bacterium B1224]|nr:hypothetical protein [Pontiellaceae bacterium B1224]
MSIDKLDQIILEKMKRFGEPAARISLFIIFFWFGILKPLGVSAAEPLVLKTVDWMPLLSARQWLHVIGWWEMIIGISFLFRKTTRLAIGLLFLQMVGTFMPLFILPEITFQENGIPFLPTLEGQYIVKNIIIISAALVIGGNLDDRK